MENIKLFLDDEEDVDIDQETKKFKVSKEIISYLEYDEYEKKMVDFTMSWIAERMYKFITNDGDETDFDITNLHLDELDDDATVKLYHKMVTGHEFKNTIYTFMGKDAISPSEENERQALNEMVSSLKPYWI